MASIAREAGSLGMSPEARRLTEENLALVPFFMNRMGMIGDRDDLEQAGRIGLMKAAEHYNPAIGKFSTYASSWIKSAIRRESDKQIAPGATAQSFLDNRLRQVTIAELQGKLGRHPTRDEIAEIVGDKVADVNIPQVMSIHINPYGEDGDHVGAWLSQEDNLALFEDLEQLDYLEPLEKALLVAHGMGYTNIEIAANLDIIPETVGARLRKLKARLQEEIR
jgi:RNA polymerase sigma factor (sigma-70 family)